MRSVALKTSMVAVATAGLAIAGLPAAHAANERAAARPATPPALGNSCLVGTWRDNPGLTSTQWNGSVVGLRAGGGDVDHIAATGLDQDDFAKAKPAVGTYRHHKLTMTVHGLNTQRLVATGSGKHARIRFIEKGWSASSSIHFRYRGRRTTGYLNGAGVSHHYHYTCTAKTLTFTGHKGNVIGTETRLSRKP